MGFSDIGLRHIVDVDGQLLGIDQEAIEVGSLLARANRSTERHVWLVRQGERRYLDPTQIVTLSEDEVLFFETAETTGWSAMERLAA